MNGSAIAQYTNTYGYTDGTILLGYNDHYSSIGDSNNFVVIDNVRVESITLSPATLSSPSVSGNTFRFTFDADAYETYRVQQTTLLPGGAWATITNLVGTGGPRTVTLPLTNNATQLYFRVVRP